MEPHSGLGLGRTASRASLARGSFLAISRVRELFRVASRLSRGTVSGVARWEWTGPESSPLPPSPPLSGLVAPLRRGFFWVARAGNSRWRSAELNAELVVGLPNYCARPTRTGAIKRHFELPRDAKGARDLQACSEVSQIPHTTVEQGRAAIQYYLGLFQHLGTWNASVFHFRFRCIYSPA
jgi:hypothetical protein